LIFIGASIQFGFRSDLSLFRGHKFGVELRPVLAQFFNALSPHLLELGLFLAQIFVDRLTIR